MSLSCLAHTSLSPSFLTFFAVFRYDARGPAGVTSTYALFLYSCLGKQTGGLEYSSQRYVKSDYSVDLFMQYAILQLSEKQIEYQSSLEVQGQGLVALYEAFCRATKVSEYS
ncbi:hypothetical protein STEG23_023688, partial [Scotinomys teguina]